MRVCDVEAVTSASANRAVGRHNFRVMSEVELVIQHPRALGSSLRQRRIDAGVTQRELGERIGFRQPAVARIEAGRQTPTIGTLQRMAEALGCDLVVRIPRCAGGRP
jgi:DNA-binding XRE family transcriptional regulator